jgi:hypothetical protein
MIPESHADLLTRELYVHLATINPDGSPQVTPVWQIWGGPRRSRSRSTTPTSPTATSRSAA